jgi:4-amino-4-deoxy-L-arabinose transferase-like glycosyltransferase
MEERGHDWDAPRLWRSDPRRDLTSLLVLAIASIGLHGWIIARTAVPARDGVMFIRYAWELQRQPWPEVLRDHPQPPLYPLTIDAVSLAFRWAVQSTVALRMQYSAQIAAALAGLLLVVPMYYLGRALFNRRVGFWSALLFQCLPVSAHVLSDGLSEGLYLLLTASFFVFASIALRRRSVAALALAGMVSGLAYLTRPEGAALAAVLLLTLCGAQWRRPWSRRRFLAGGTALLAGALVPAVPYICVIHGFSNKTTAGWIWQSLAGSPAAMQHSIHMGSDEVRLAAAMPPARGEGPDRGGDITTLALPCAVWHPNWRVGAHASALGWAFGAVVAETHKTFHYVLWLPALLGMWWFPSRLRTRPVAAVMGITALLHTLVLIRMAMVAGYVSERHTLLFALLGMPWAAAGIGEIPRRIGIIGKALGFSPRVFTWGGRERTVASCLIVVMAAYGLPIALKPLHASKRGFRDAGLWVANHADHADVVIDPFGWSEYYANRVLPGLPLPSPAPGHVPCYYVILDRTTLSDHRSALPLLPDAIRLSARGTLVYHWPEQRPAEQADVSVFAVPASDPVPCSVESADMVGP